MKEVEIPIYYYSHIDSFIYVTIQHFVYKWHGLIKWRRLKSWVLQIIKAVLLSWEFMYLNWEVHTHATILIVEVIMVEVWLLPVAPAIMTLTPVICHKFHITVYIYIYNYISY